LAALAGLAVTDLAVTDLATLADLAAVTDLATLIDLAAVSDLAAGDCFATADGLDTAARVAVEVVAILVAVPEIGVPVRVAAGLVGAFLAAAIGMFLLANDCGLVSAWRLRSSGLDTGSRRRPSLPPLSSGRPRRPTPHCASRPCRVPAWRRQPWRTGRDGIWRDIGRRRSRPGCVEGTRNSRPRQAHCRS